MTARRLMVLVRGLGPHSATMLALYSTRYMGDGGRRPVAPDSQTPEQSERILGAMFAGARVN